MYVGDFPYTMVAGTGVDPASLACLSSDSRLEPARGFRADPGQARVLIFTSALLSLELEVMADHVVGQIVPPGPGEVVAENSDGVRFRTEADDMGFFDFADIPRGRVRLRADTPTGQLVTNWICL
jgi:hypothetical protein